jgi:hypothetical protein
MKKRDPFWASLCWGFLATAFMFSCNSSSTSTGPSQPAAVSYFSVEGSIFYSTTLITDATVQVSLTPSDWTLVPAQQAETATGTYRFPSIRQGKYLIAAKALNNEDYCVWTGESLRVDGNTTKDIFLCKMIRWVSPPDYGTVKTLRPTLVWDNLPEAVLYSIEVTDAVGSPVEEASGITGTSYTVTKDLVDQGIYYWTVRAYNNQGTRIGSGGARFTVSLQ